MTKNRSCNDKIPPGVIISNSFIEFEPKKNQEPKQTLSFYNLGTPFNDKPLPPLVRAKLITNNQEDAVPYVIKVYNIIFLYDGISTEKISVYLQQDPIIPSMLNFYISYGRTPEPTTILNPVAMNFTIPTFIKPSMVKVFLWNKDPETSRGTVTSVKQGV